MIKDLYFTHVEAVGSLVITWAQCDKKTSEVLEGNIKSVNHLLETNIITNPVQQLSNGKLCLMKLKNDFYRVKILSLSKLDQNSVAVFLVDYGNTFEVRMDSLRLIDTADAMYPFITNFPHMATHFYLAEVQPPGGNVWPPQTIDFIRQTLASKAFRCNVLEVEPIKNLIHIYLSNDSPATFSSILYSRGLAQTINLQMQIAVIQALSHTHTHLTAAIGAATAVAPVMKAQAPPVVPTVHAMPPPIMPAPSVPNATLMAPISAMPPMPSIPMLRRPTPSVTVSQYTSVKLQPGTRHAVYISHVEEGVLSFAVQLKSEADDILPRFMVQINDSFKGAPVDGLLMPGTLCLARYTVDNAICRAVVSDVIDDKVKVYYVDFGNWELLPPSEVFAIPSNLLAQKVMASKFSLAGVKDDPEWKEKAMKDYFHEFAGDKEFVLDVKPNETSSVTQYCDLYHNGHDVKELLKKHMEKISPFSYRDPPSLAIGSFEDVKVAFVESPMRFFLNLSRFQKDLDTVMSNVASYCNSAKGSLGLISADDATINLPCCAFYDFDQKWYRAQILDNSDPTALIVRYVDYGNSETVPLNSLRRIDKKLVQDFFIQAIECCLYGFESVKTTPGDDLITHFEETTLEQSFKMKVIGALSPKTYLIDLINSDNQSLSLLMKNFKPAVEQVPVTIKTEPVQNHVEEGWSEKQTFNGQHTAARFKFNGTNQRNHDTGSSKNKFQNDNFGPVKKHLGQLLSREDNWRKPRNEDNWRNKDGNGGGDRKFGGGFNNRSQDGERSFDRDGGFKGRNREEGFKGRRDGGFQRNDDFSSRNQNSSNDNWSSGQDSGPRSRNRDDGFKDKADRGFRSSRNNDDWSGGQETVSSNDIDWSKSSNRDTDWSKRSNKDTDWSGGQDKKSNDGWSGGQDRGDGGFSSRPKKFDGERKFGGERNFDKRSDDGSESKPWKSRDDFSSRPFKPRKEPGFPPGSTFSRTTWEAGAENEVQIPWFVNPGQFYVQLLSTNSEFRTMMEMMQREYGKREKADSNSLNVGDCVAAKFSQDKVIYRAQIKESSFGTFSVEFVDFGNCANASSDSIWNVSSDHCELPCQAVLCCLNGIAPADESGEWNKEALKKVFKMFQKDKYICTVVSYDEEKSLHHVNLLDVSDNTDVAQQLIAEGIAVSTLQEQTGLESEDPVDLSLLVNQTVWAHMCNIVSRSQFFVHLEKTKLDSIQTAVDTYITSYGETEIPKLTEDQIRQGEYCIASSDGETWYRAQITDLNGTTGVIVTFIDYGDTADVARDSLCAIYDDLLISPGQAVECYLLEKGEVDDEKLEDYMANDDTAVVLSVHSMDETGRLCVTVFDRDGSDLFSQSGVTINPFCHLPVMRQREKVFLSHAENSETDRGSFIALQYAAYADALSEFLDTLHEYAESAEQLSDPSIETICVAKSTADEQWYRAKIISTDPEIFVEYLDYGNSEAVPLENLRKIDSSLAHPPLFAVSPVFLPISSFDASELLATYSDSELIANFKHADGKWFADLETSDGVRICTMLVESGKAEELEPLPYEQPSSTLSKWQLAGPSPVICSYVDNVNCFFLQLASESEELEQLQNNLQQDVLKMMPLIGRSEKVFAAKYVVDDTWYRAEFSTDGMVRFIDYGNEDALDEIKKLPAKYLSEPFSVACSLPVIPVKGSEWSEEINDKFRSLVEAEDLQGELVSVGESAALVKLSTNDKQVSDILINEGLAAPKPQMVSVSYINSLTDFYVQDDLSACDGMAEKLANADSWNTEDVLAEGLLVAAKFDEDELFYRAKIIETSENSTQVLFIDYGNTATVTEIKQLPQKLKAAEPLAKKCKLDLSVELIAPETIEKFKELSNFGETLFVLVVKEMEAEPKVDLILEDKSVTEQLVEFNGQNIEIVAKISNINSLDSFYVQKISEESLLVTVTSALESGSTLETASDVAEGLLVAAKFEDDLYYRGKVLPDLSVFFIDYGNVATSEDLRILPEEIISIPPLAKHCALQKPKDMEFPESAEDQFFGFTEEPELKIRFINFDDPRLVTAELNGQNVVDLLLQAPSQEVVEAAETSEGDGLVCTVTHINSPSDFFVQLDTDNLVMVESTLSASNLEPIPTEDISVGAMVAAKFVEDGTWYRAEVLSKDETSGYSVLFIDYGNTSVATEFAAIPEEIFSIPALALKYSITPPSGLDEWPNVVNEAFAELIAANEYNCQILGDGDSGSIDLLCGGVVISQELAKHLGTVTEGSTPSAIEEVFVKTEFDNDMVIEESSFVPKTEITEEGVGTGFESTSKDTETTIKEEKVTSENDNSMSEEFSGLENSFADHGETENRSMEVSPAESGKVENAKAITSPANSSDLDYASVKNSPNISTESETSGLEYSPANHFEPDEKNDSVDISEIQKAIDDLDLDVSAGDIQILKETRKSSEVIDLRESPGQIDLSVEDLDECDRDLVVEDASCRLSSPDKCHIRNGKSVDLSKFELEECEIPSPQTQVTSHDDSTASNFKTPVKNGDLQSPELAIKRELTYEEAQAANISSSNTVELDDTALSFSSSANTTIIEADESRSSRIFLAEDKIVAGSISRGDLFDPPVPKTPLEEKIVSGAISSLDLSSLENALEAATDDECSPELVAKPKNPSAVDGNQTSVPQHKPISLDEKLCAQLLKGEVETDADSLSADPPKSVPKIPQDEKVLPAQVSGLESSNDEGVL